MSDTSQNLETEPVRFSGQFVTGPQFAGRITAASFLSILLRPSRLVPRVILVALILVASAVAISTSPGAAVIGPAIFVTAYVVFFVGVYLIGYQVARRRIAHRVPVGSVWTIQMRDSTFVLSQPMVRSDLSYDLYKSASRSGRFVVLERRMSSMPTLLPAELFTDESLAYFQSKVASPLRSAK